MNLLDTKNMDLHTFLITVIAFSAVISVLSFAFNLLLVPIKQDISTIKENQTNLKTNQARMEKELISVIKFGQKEMEDKILQDVSEKIENLFSEIMKIEQNQNGEK